jgi:RecG-like helicase
MARRKSPASISRRSLRRWPTPAGIRRHSHRPRARARRTAPAGAARPGRHHLLIGTHALYSDDVAFADLTLALVD